MLSSHCRRNTRASALSFNALQAMSALLCCGPVFHPTALDKDSTIYRWLKNMLSSGEPRVSEGGFVFSFPWTPTHTHELLHTRLCMHMYAHSYTHTHTHTHARTQIQTLGRKTVQMLLENNTHHTLLSWVIDHCYESKAECAQLCFHALSNTLADM